MGRPPIGKAAMSGAERVRRWRLEHGRDRAAGGEIAALEARLARARTRVAELQEALRVARAIAQLKAMPPPPAPEPQELLAGNERRAPGGKLQWHRPNARWHRLRAQALVPFSAREADTV
jgi:hypothetical protein